jgi:hypothetical protein
MKITGWEKLKGITYKGYSIINPMVNAVYTQYFADVLDIQSHRQMELRLDTDAGFRDSSYVLTIRDRFHNVVVKRMVDFEMLKRISSFRIIYEHCIDDYIREVEKGVSLVNATNVATPISHSIVSNVTKRINGGISQFDTNYGTMSLPTFDDFQKTWWRSKPVSKFTQTLINK